MTQNETKRKERIEQSLLDSMNSMDEALRLISSLGNHHDNYQKVRACKTQIKQVLNASYDRLAREKRLK